jgi:hypothetical protein
MDGAIDVTAKPRGGVFVKTKLTTNLIMTTNSLLSVSFLTNLVNAHICQDRLEGYDQIVSRFRWYGLKKISPRKFLV